MRIFVFILALLGGLACGGVGFLWKDVERSPKMKEALRWADRLESSKDWEQAARAEGKDPDEVREMVAKLRQLLILTNVLLAAFPLAFVGGVFALKRQGLFAALLLLLTAAVPLYFAWRLASIERILLIVGVAT